MWTSSEKNNLALKSNKSVNYDLLDHGLLRWRNPHNSSEIHLSRLRLIYQVTLWLICTLLPKLLCYLQWLTLSCCPCTSWFLQREMAMKQIHMNQVQISFCFIPKSYFWHSILWTVVMDQHWKSVMASMHNQQTSSSEKSGECTVTFCNIYYI